MPTEDRVGNSHDENGRFVSVREYLEELEAQRWESHKEAHARQREEQTRLADQLQQYKVQSNEWRASLNDQAAKFVSRELFDALIDKHNILERRIAYYSGAAAAAGALIAVVIRLSGIA